MDYEEVYPGVSLNLAECSIDDALSQIGPSFVYDCYVSEQGFWNAKRILKDALIQNENNPFWVHVNLHMEPDFKRDEWCLSANGKSFGSEGA